MKRSLFGFKPVPLSTIELTYNADCSPSHYYLQMERQDYPCHVYAKFSREHEILEMYPVYLNSAKNSIDVITKNLLYKGSFNWKYYAYMSWDMKNEPTEIYLPKPDVIEKYKNETLDAKYFTVDMDKLDECKDLTDEIRDFARKSEADVFMYVTKNDELKKFCLIYNFANEHYLDKRLLAKPLQDEWLEFQSQ